VNVVSPKKLIEVALPLDAINKAAAKEKSIRHGHPSTLHLWWARRPLAAARAVIFSQLVHDPEDLWRCKNPGKEPNPQERGHWTKARAKLFKVIEDLVLWENTTNETVLEAAREEIRRAWRETCELNKDHPQAKELFDPTKMPGLHDPFAGGGSIPLEAQRLGLEAHASDLNPVAVLINKAMIEIPPKFAGRPPVHPEARKELREKRNEQHLFSGDDHALPGDDGVAEGNGSGAGGVPAGSETAEGGNLRDAVADHARRRVDPGQLRGGVGPGIDEGEGALHGDRAGVAGGDGNPPGARRADRMVPAERNTKGPRASRRGQSNAHDPAAENAGVVGEGTSGEERGKSRNAASGSVPLSSPLFPGSKGLAEDVRRYGQWMRDEAFKRVGHLYPPVEVTKEMAKERPDLKQYVGEKLTVIAWLWARTVKSPNPAFSHVDVPLVSTFILSSKEGKESYVQPVKDGDTYHFTVKVGTPPESAKAGTTAGKRAAFICLMSKVPIDYDYIRTEGQAGRMGQRLMAIVVEGTQGRIYISPTAVQEAVGVSAKSDWKPDLQLPDNTRDFKTPNYGMMTYGDLCTPRQLVALTTFSGLVGEVREKIKKDAAVVGLPNTTAQP